MSVSFQKRLLDARQARDFIAERTGRDVSLRWIYVLINEGRLPAVQLDKLVIDEADIVAFLQELPRVQPVAAPTPAAELQPALPANTTSQPAAPATARRQTRARAGARS